MTPEERAQKLLDGLHAGGWLTYEVFAEVIRAAIAEERETCAKVAADQGCTKVACGRGGHGYHACPQSIAAAIRARK